MAYGSISLERRLKENSKNYSLADLLNVAKINAGIEALHNLCNVGILLTERHGEPIISCGDFSDVIIDVEENPGIKIRVAKHTLGHVYLQFDYVDDSQRIVVLQFVETLTKMFESMAEKTFYQNETAAYANELEEKILKEKFQVEHGKKEDALTGVLNRLYFSKRSTLVDRAQLAPVAAICININDWKFVNEHYGDEESDRLIKVVADIIKAASKPEYIVGRVDGDVFNVVIPVPEEGEAEVFCKEVKNACNMFEDDHLAPSVAIGMVMKENVEIDLSDTFSDAEYEMFQDKFIIKNANGYRKRLEKGLLK